MRKAHRMVFTVLFPGTKEQHAHKLWSKTGKSWAVGLLGMLMLVSQIEASYSAKKGVGAGNLTKIEALNVSWYYNWNIQRVAGVDPAIEYVPMKHNQWWRNQSELANIGEFNYFLGFNEPERSDQGNISVANAISQWPSITAAVEAYGTPGAQMGSPATANPNIQWIIDFMNQVEANNLRVDFMAMHKYPTPTSSGGILNGAQWYHDTYGKDVWITEFNGADWTAPNDYTHDQGYTWMAEVLWRLESTPYIKRYAIFPWNGTTSASAATGVFVVDGQGNVTGELTPLGKLYAEYHENDIYGPYEQIWYYVHNMGSRMRLNDNAGTPSTATVYTEGAAVEFELAPAGGVNYYIVNQGTGEYLGSDGSAVYWTSSETGNSVQWTLTADLYNWKNITHVGSGNYLYGQSSGVLGLSSLVSDDTYRWDFIRSGTPYGATGNNAPTFTVDPISKPNATEGAAYSDTIAGSATDADNDPLSYSALSGPAWLSIASAGTLSGTPGNPDGGLNSWTVQVSDGNGGSDTATLNITVNASGIATMTTGYTTGSGLLIPAGETLFVDTAVLGGSDTTAGSGYSDSFTVLIDGSGLWNIGDTVEITGVALPIHANTANGTMTFTVRQGAGGVGDTGAGGLAVLGSATASYANSGATGNMYVNFTTPVSFVADASSTSIGINIANSASLTLKNQPAGIYPLTQYNQSTGNTVGSMNFSVAGTVSGSNPPAFTADPISKANATEDSAYSASIAGDASDPESDPMTFSKVSGPTWLSVASNGILSGTPVQGDVGANAFTVQVSASGGSDTATLNITVDNVNDAPVFTVDPINEANAAEGAAYSGSIANATDEDNDPLTYSKVSGPAWLSVAANGTLSGTPGAGDIGANAFSVQVIDGNGGSDTAALNITVIDPNAAVDDFANADVIGSGSVSGSYVDTQISDNSYEAITEVESGGKPSNRHSLMDHRWTINVTGGNSIIFYVEAYHGANSEGDDFVFAYSTDNVNFTDMVTVTKTADDDIAELFALPNTLSGTVYIRVTDTDSSQGNKGLDTVYIDEMYIRSSGEAPPNQAPSFSSDPVVEVDGAVDISYSAALSDDATDPEGDPMTFSKVSGPLWLSVASDGSLSGTPTAADEGLNTFTVQVDATGGTDTATLNITVNAGMPSVHVSSIVPGVAAANGPNQYGVATVTILDASDQPVSGATVSGTFTGSFSESGSAVTDGSGVAVIQTAGKTKNPSFTFTVDSVTASGYAYDSVSNVETSDSY